MFSPAFTEALRIEVGTLQLKHPVMAESLARAHAILTNGLLFPEDDGETATVVSSNSTQTYRVNGTCQCAASIHREEPCKHRVALRLYQRVSEQLHAAVVPEVSDDLPRGVEKRFVTYISNKPFVQYAGLLALAHACGLLRLEARIDFQSADVVYASATATFADGKVFTEAADASPSNVKFAAHFPRFALTRAKARALRDALNIGLVCLEELEQ